MKLTKYKKIIPYSNHDISKHKLKTYDILRNNYTRFIVNFSPFGQPDFCEIESIHNIFNDSCCSRM